MIYFLSSFFFFFFFFFFFLKENFVKILQEEVAATVKQCKRKVQGMPQSQAAALPRPMKALKME